MKKKQQISPLRLIALILCAGVFLFAASRLLAIRQEDAALEEAHGSLAQQAVTIRDPMVPVTPPETEPLGDLQDPEAIPTLPPESYEIPISVDFDTLLEACPDIVGWLYCADTPMNYPVVQAQDNDYYLHRLPDGSRNAGGTLFMDYRNASDLSDRNTVIYGHNMKGGHMFGFFTNYRSQSYYDSHSVMWYLTPACAYKLELLTGFVTPADSQAYHFYDSDEKLAERLQECVGYSTFRSAISAEGVMRIMTLSTCSYEYEDARYVLVAKITPAPYPS